MGDALVKLEDADSNITIDGMQRYVKSLAQLDMKFLLSKLEEINSKLGKDKKTPEERDQISKHNKEANLIKRAIQHASIPRVSTNPVPTLDRRLIANETGPKLIRNALAYLEGVKGYIKPKGSFPQIDKKQYTPQIKNPVKNQSQAVLKAPVPEETLGVHKISNLQGIARGLHKKYPSIYKSMPNSHQKIFRTFLGLKSKTVTLRGIAMRHKTEIPAIRKKLSEILLKHFNFNVHEREEEFWKNNPK